MIYLKVNCPICSKSLLDASHIIDDKPSVRLTVKYAEKEGDLYLSSYYGSYKVDCQLPIPEGEVVDLFCPHCGANLKSTRVCDLCGANMAVLSVAGSGKIQICERKGCRKHIIEFEDLVTELQMFYDSTGL